MKVVAVITKDLREFNQRQTETHRQISHISNLIVYLRALEQKEITLKSSRQWEIIKLKAAINKLGTSNKQEIANLQKYHWVHFVVAIYCWAARQILRIVFTPRENPLGKTNFLICERFSGGGSFGLRCGFMSTSTVRTGTTSGPDWRWPCTCWQSLGVHMQIYWLH